MLAPLPALPGAAPRAGGSPEAAEEGTEGVKLSFGEMGLNNG